MAYLLILLAEEKDRALEIFLSLLWVSISQESSRKDSEKEEPKRNIPSTLFWPEVMCVPHLRLLSVAQPTTFPLACSHNSCVLVPDCSPMHFSHLHQASETSQTEPSAGALPVLSRAEAFLLVWWGVFLQLEIWIFFAVSWWGLLFCLCFIMMLGSFSSACCSCSHAVDTFRHMVLCSFLVHLRCFDFSLSASIWQLSVCAINLLSVLLPSYQYQLNRTGPSTAVCCSSCCYLL